MKGLHPEVPTELTTAQQLAWFTDKPGKIDTMRAAPDELRRGGGPRLIGFGGLPAGGKSTLAREVAAHHGCLLIETDYVRKFSAGVPYSVRWPSGAPYFGDVARRAAYEHAMTHVRAALTNGYSVVLVATWVKGGIGFGSRLWLAEEARRCGASFDGIFVSVPMDIAADRMKLRELAGDDVSDANEMKIFTRLEDVLLQGGGVEQVRQDGWWPVDNSANDNGAAALANILRHLGQG